LAGINGVLQVLVAHTQALTPLDFLTSRIFKRQCVTKKNLHAFEDSEQNNELYNLSITKEALYWTACIPFHFCCTDTTLYICTISSQVVSVVVIVVILVLLLLPL
jgi:hypothetical protein